MNQLIINVDEIINDVQTKLTKMDIDQIINDVRTNNANLTSVNRSTAEELQQIFKAYGVSYEEMDERQYSLNVDYNLMDHLEDITADRFRVIKISYPGECFALPFYLTSKDLKHCYKQTKNGLYDEYIENIRELIEI